MGLCVCVCGLSHETSSFEKFPIFGGGLTLRSSVGEVHFQIDCQSLGHAVSSIIRQQRNAGFVDQRQTNAVAISDRP